MTIPLETLLDRSAAHVDRWHSALTVGRENVAEHQFFVGWTAWLLARLLQEREWDVVPYQTLLFGLVHDLPEVETGDVPHQVKRLHPDLFEDLEDEVVDDLAARHGSLGLQVRGLLRQYRESPEYGLERQVVALADRLAAIAFMCEEADLGSVPMFNRRARAAAQTLEDFAGLDWWPAVCEEVPDLADRLEVWASLYPGENA